MDRGGRHAESALWTRVFLSFTFFVVLISAFLTTALYQHFRTHLRQDMRDRLHDIVSVAALQIDAEAHNMLAKPEDENTETYLKLRANLQAVRNSVTGIRFIHTMRRGQNDEIVFVLDAETNAVDVAGLGKIYDDASPLLARSFANLNGTLVEEDFYTDKWGTWLTGYAPFYTEMGNRAGVVGVDIDARNILAGERRFLLTSLPVLVAAIPAILFLAWFFSHWLARGAATAKKALADSERQLRALSDASFESIFLSEKGICLGQNRTAERMFGYTSEEAIGNPGTDWIVPEDRDMVMKHMLADHTAPYEATALRKDGTTFTAEIQARMIEHEGRQVRVTALRDITERKHLEEDRLRLERQMLHAQKLESLGVLAGGIAHDFNNILMTILGNVELASTKIPPRSAESNYLMNIETATKRAAELTAQMLAYSGKGHFVIEPIHINRFIEEIGHMLEVSISKKAVLKYDFADNLPVFDGDAAQINQIIMNLVTNASEAIGDKSGIIAISTGVRDCDSTYLRKTNVVTPTGLEEPLKEGLYVFLEVTDTGYGMDAETLTKLFDPFFSTKFTGRGLGMAATLGIVRGHKGAIKVSSEKGKGSTFRILFPAAPDTPDSLPPEGHEEATDDKWRGAGLVLLADDEESLRTLGKCMLEELGFTALTAAHGREAVDLFREHADEIVCVLLDLTMPHLDGEQAFREMRRIDPNIKVLLASGYNEQQATERFAGTGLAGFIQKPYKSEALAAALRNAIEA